MIFSSAMLSNSIGFASSVVNNVAFIAGLTLVVTVFVFAVVGVGIY